MNKQLSEIWNIQTTAKTKKSETVYVCSLCTKQSRWHRRKKRLKKGESPSPPRVPGASRKPFLEFISKPQADNNKELLSLWLQPPRVNHSLINLESNDQVKDALLFLSPRLFQMPPHSTLPHVRTLRRWNTFPVTAVTVHCFSTQKEI